MTGINVSLAFCMGTDLNSITSSSQPMATIFFNSFGQKGTLAVWAVVVIAQYMMGSSMVRQLMFVLYILTHTTLVRFSPLLVNHLHFPEMALCRFLAGFTV